MVQISPLPQEVQAQVNTGDLDTRSVPCKEPPWLVKQFPYFKLAGCEGHELQELTLHLTSGTKTLSGKTTSNIYSLTERNRRPTTIALQKNFINALQKIGATLVSDPANVATAVLTRTSAQGEYWYVYEQAEGNSDAVSSYKLTTVQIAQLVQEVQAQSNATDLDTHSAQCKDPSWLVKQFSYFKLESCRGLDFQEIALSLPAGRKILAGKTSMSLYVLSDINRRPTAMVVQKNYVNALQQIGAKLVSDPSNSGQIVFTRTVPQGEFWYIYDQAGGNSDAVPAYTLTTVQIAPLLQEVQAQATPAPLEAATTGCKDPSWLVKQFSYFKLGSCNFADIDSITLDLEGGKKTLAGRILHHTYGLTDHVRQPVSITVWRNYVNALQAIGAKLVSIPTKSDEAVLTRTTPQGVFWYIYRQSGGGSDGVSAYDLITVQVGGPPPKACTMEIYGVNFDFNKATLRPDSDPVLNQVLALFSADPTYTGEIGGHTDNIGKPDYNLKLSGQRADAVKAWLVANGVGATRLTTHGYGDGKPLVPNTNDENRFKNRRVELKRANCK
jgi:outer membrane protein OmpA-like peptidoglycan-associated protein